jgi:hypothetical protein
MTNFTTRRDYPLPRRLKIAIANAIAKVSRPGQAGSAIDPLTAKPVRYAAELDNEMYLLALQHQAWAQSPADLAAICAEWTGIVA